MPKPMHKRRQAHPTRRRTWSRRSGGSIGRHPVGARRRGLGREEGDVLHLSTPEGVGLDLRRSWNSYHNMESVGEISAWEIRR